MEYGTRSIDLLDMLMNVSNLHISIRCGGKLNGYRLLTYVQVDL